MSLRPIICVDLDHTLIQTDLTVQVRRRFIQEQGLKAILSLGWWAVKGLFTSSGYMATLKTHLARSMTPEIAHLPYDPLVLEELRHWKGQGHRLVLATGAPWAWAQQVAQHLKIFDDVWGTHDCNLIGHNKARLLIERYGEGDFMYYGDSPSDLKVWPHAHSGVAVNPGALVRQKLSALSIPMRILETPLLTEHTS